MATPSALALTRARHVLDLESQDLPTPRGYIDLLGDERSPTSIAQALMLSRFVPLVYERWWRPALGRVMKGPRGPSMRREHRLVRELLSLADGATALDVACGPGGFTRTIAEDVGEQGTVIGIDLSATMLGRAAADTEARQVVYVRADATHLSLSPASVDAVSCLAALHLFCDPWAALDDMARALVPGGRLVILTTVRPRSPAAALAARGLGRASGLRMFGADEVSGALADRGLELTFHRTWGIAQIVCGSRSHGP